LRPQGWTVGNGLLADRFSPYIAPIQPVFQMLNAEVISVFWKVTFALIPPPERMQPQPGWGHHQCPMYM